MKHLLPLLTIILLLGCDCNNQSRADNTPNFHYHEGQARSSLTPMVYHDDARHTTCWVLWQSSSGSSSASDAIAMTCIPDWQLHAPEKSK